MYLLSLIPVAIAFLAVVKTKKAFESCLLGIFSALVIYAFENQTWNLAALFYSFLSDVMSDATNVWVIVFTLIIGMFTEIIDAAKATDKFCKWVRKFADNEKKTLLSVVIMGIVIYADEFLKGVVLGSYCKSIGRRNRIPVETMGFLITVLCIPLVILMPFTTWSVYFVQLIEGAGITENGTVDYITKVIPYLFFPIVLMVIVVLFVAGVLPALGNIRKANRQVKDNTYDFSVYGEEEDVEAKADADGKRRTATVADFLVPLAVLAVCAAFNGGDLVIGIIITMVFMLFWYLIRRVMGFDDYMGAFYRGMNAMLKPTAYLMLGYEMTAIMKQIGFPELVQAVASILLPGAVLAFFFVAATIIGTLTGMFWPTTSMFLAACLPVTTGLGISPFVLAGTLFSAAAIGSVLSPRGALIMLIGEEINSNPVDVMRTTRPYVLIAGAITVAAYLILGFVVC
ncbi:MAG: Na+/H+ antiporter NhaC family protein [Clostridium sp.]|nr:Na+/H+ antiporter NhaC family protein [Clostridium sp.]